MKGHFSLWLVLAMIMLCFVVPHIGLCFGFCVWLRLWGWHGKLENQSPPVAIQRTAHQQQLLFAFSALSSTSHISMTCSTSLLSNWNASRNHASRNTRWPSRNTSLDFGLRRGGWGGFLTQGRCNWRQLKEVSAINGLRLRIEDTIVEFASLLNCNHLYLHVWRGYTRGNLLGVSAITIAWFALVSFGFRWFPLVLLISFDVLRLHLICFYFMWFPLIFLDYLWFPLI